jgi:hypothetical protein
LPRNFANWWVLVHSDHQSGKKYLFYRIMWWLWKNTSYYRILDRNEELRGQKRNTPKPHSWVVFGTLQDFRKKLKLVPEREIPENQIQGSCFGWRWGKMWSANSGYIHYCLCLIRISLKTSAQIFSVCACTLTEQKNLHGSAIFKKNIHRCKHFVFQNALHFFFLWYPVGYC